MSRNGQPRHDAIIKPRKSIKLKPSPQGLRPEAIGRTSWNSLLNVFHTDPSSSKLDCAEFHLDILEAIKGLNFAPPIKAQTLTTESCIVVGGKTIDLNDGC